MTTLPNRRLRAHQGGCHRRPDGPALRSWGPPTPTSRGWSSATSTPRAACSGATSSCASRTAPRTTPSRARWRRSSSSDDKVDVVFGGIFSSTRQAIKAAAVTAGQTLYLYPEQYEGGESDPLIFCTGPGPAQQIDRFIPWLMRETGARTFYFPSADYIWPHVLNARVREVVTANGGSIVGEEYFPLDHMEYAATVERITASGADVVFNTIVPPGRRAVLRGALRIRLHASRRAPRVHLLRRELPQHGAGRARRGPLRLPRLLPGRRRPVQPQAARAVRRALPRRGPVHGRQRMLGAVPRAAPVGRRRERGGLARAGGRDRSARPRDDRRGPGRPRSRRSGPAPPAPEHVHRAGPRTAASRSSRASAHSTRRSARSASRRSAPDADRAFTHPHTPTSKERDDATRDDAGGGLRPFHGRVLERRGGQAQAARFEGRARSSAIPPRTTGSG